MGFEGTSLPGELRVLLAEGLAGVALYRRNWETVEDLRGLTNEIRSAARGPVLIGIDQEGGTPFSLPEPFTQWPSPADFGRLQDSQAVYEAARAMAREMGAAGINLNFAPMLDLHTHPASPVTRGRSYGSDPQLVAEMGTAFLRGFQEEGVLACAKHFPGHGDAAVDPHLALPVFEGNRRRLERTELVPFAAAIRAGILLIMTAHILLPRLDPERPASLSRRLLQEILRESMGFSGIVVADDLGMGAVAGRFRAGEAAIESFRAGSDLAMLCHDFSLVRPALDAANNAVVEGTLRHNEWHLSWQRIEHAAAMAEKEGSDAGLEVIGCAAHRELAKELRARVARTN